MKLSSERVQSSTHISKPRRHRLALLLGTGGVLIGAVCFVWAFWLYHPVGTGPAGPSVSAAAFSEQWSNRSVLLVGLGDSVTDGLGASPSSRSYFNRLSTNPSDEWTDMKGKCLDGVLPNLRTLNLARSGSNSIENLELLIPRLETQDRETYGIVVMTTGGNDLIHYYGRRPAREGAMYGASIEEARPWIQNYRIRLTTTVNQIESRFPGGCSIFLGDIYDPTDGIGSALTYGLPRWPDGLTILSEYNDAIRECCEQHTFVHKVDIHGPFLGHGIYSMQFWGAHYDSDDPSYWYWENFEDPNNRGYDAIRRLFLNRIIEVVPEALKL